MNNNIELTDEERKAIRRVKRAFANWPRSLLVFGGASGISIRKPDEDGSYFIDRIVDYIDGVPCDGGDGGDERPAIHTSY